MEILILFYGIQINFIFRSISIERTYIFYIKALNVIPKIIKQNKKISNWFEAWNISTYSNVYNSLKKKKEYYSQRKKLISNSIFHSSVQIFSAINQFLHSFFFHIQWVFSCSLIYSFKPLIFNIVHRCCPLTTTT